MHVISKKRLREFWGKHPDARTALLSWHRVAQKADWGNFAAVRGVYASADQVGRFTVFNIGGNKYRLVAEINYARRKVFVRHVLTHAAYDAGAWKGG